MKSTSWLLLLALFVGSAVNADELQVIISGKAFHIGADNLNEDNYGLGLQYDFSERRRWIPLIGLASLKDSNNHTSRYIGAGIKRRYKLSSAPDQVNFDAGVFALAMRRPGYNNDEPFFGAIPFVSLGNDWGGINLTYVPKIEDDMYAFWYFQFSLKLLQI